MRLRVIRPCSPSDGSGPRYGRGARRRPGPVPYQRQPRQHGDGGRRSPHAQAQPPATAHGAGERHGHGGGHGRAQRKGHGVDAGDGADPVGEVALDDHRHQHVGHRYAAQGERAGDEEDRGVPCQRAQQEPAGDRDHAGADDGAGPVAAGQAGRGEAEEREAGGGHGGEQPGHGAAHAEAAADLLEQGAEAGDRGAEVDGGEDQRGDDEAAHPEGGRHSGGLRGAPQGRVYGARCGLQGEGFVVSHGPIIE